MWKGFGDGGGVRFVSEVRLVLCGEDWEEWLEGRSGGDGDWRRKICFLFEEFWFWESLWICEEVCKFY